MANGEPFKRLPAPAGALARPKYEAGYYLAVKDLLTEQRYCLQRLRRHNRHLHGWGVVCGLHIVPAREPRRPWAMLVCPGYAIGPYGDEIEVPTPALVDVRDYLWRRPHDHGRPVGMAYVGVRYTEEQGRPIPANPPGCGCDDTIYEPSRIRDGFQVDVLWALPKAADASKFDICEQRVAPCPDCPDSPYVVLACVTLPLSEGDPITCDRIDNFVRRQLYSTRTFQEQLITCCCKEVADLHIAKEVSSFLIGPGRIEQHLITVTNRGPSTADDVIVEDDFSPSRDDVEIGEFQTSQGQWIRTWPTRPFRAHLGQLEPSQVATLGFTVFVPGGGQTTTTPNTVTVRSDTPDPDASNNRFTI
jgi:hypothetical protein